MIICGCRARAFNVDVTTPSRSMKRLQDGHWLSPTPQPYLLSDLNTALRLIVLDVSGHKYRTQEVTLQSSPYFKSLLARWDDRSDRQEDGSYYIDADADVFHHVLNFMRRPSKFPLFWTKERGFDYALYNKLEVEADYFLLHDLRDWVREKRYLNAVKSIIEIKALSGHELEDDKNQTRHGSDIEIESFFWLILGRKALFVAHARFIQGTIHLSGAVTRARHSYELMDHNMMILQRGSL